MRDEEKKVREKPMMKSFSFCTHTNMIPRKPVPAELPKVLFRTKEGKHNSASNASGRVYMHKVLKIDAGAIKCTCTRC